MNKLNNDITNLRLATVLQNNQNNVGKGYSKRGAKRGIRYIARINVDKLYVYLGTFDREEDARNAYLEARKKYFGEFS